MQTLLKIKEAVAGMEDAKPADGDEEEDAEKQAKDAEETLQDFLDTADAPGLEDHPDTDINPVFMYQIKLAKDHQRMQQQRELMAADGMTEEEIEARMLMQAEGIGGVGEGKQNALAVLIAAGARVEATNNAQNEEALKKTELRRKQRNIAVHLSKNFGIETSTDKPVEGVKGKRSAYMVALDTRLNPVGGPKMRREVEQITRAKQARVLYRHYKKVKDATKKRRGERISTVPDLDSAPQQRRGGLLGTDASGIQLTMEEEEPEEEGEEEEGEEYSEADFDEDAIDGDDDKMNA